MECSRVPAIQAISTSVTFGFLIAAMFMFATAIEKNLSHAEVVSYRMQVLDKIDTYNYWVREIGDDGRTGQPYLWRECIEPSHPDFDPGMTVIVWTKDMGCKSFYDQQRTGWKVFRNAEGKFIDWRTQ